MIFFKKKAQIASGEHDHHKKYKQTRHITEDRSRIRQIRPVTMSCLRYRQCQGNHRRRLEYDVHWIANEAGKDAAAQNHEHTSNGGELKALDAYKCKQSHGEAATAARHRWGNTTFSQLRDALAYVHCKWLRSTRNGTKAGSLTLMEADERTVMEGTAAAGQRRGHTTFSPLIEALAFLQCKWPRWGKLPYHRLSLNMSGNQMSCHKHAGVIMIRDAYSDVHTRPGKGAAASG